MTPDKVSTRPVDLRTNYVKIAENKLNKTIKNYSIIYKVSYTRTTSCQLHQLTAGDGNWQTSSPAVKKKIKHVCFGFKKYSYFTLSTLTKTLFYTLSTFSNEWEKFFQVISSEQCNRRDVRVYETCSPCIEPLENLNRRICIEKYPTGFIGSKGVVNAKKASIAKKVFAQNHTRFVKVKETIKKVIEEQLKPVKTTATVGYLYFRDRLQCLEIRHWFINIYKTKCKINILLSWK